jgi:hypothetical protein
VVASRDERLDSLLTPVQARTLNELLATLHQRLTDDEGAGDVD